MGMEVKLAETGPIEGTNNRPVYLDMQVCGVFPSLCAHTRSC